MAQCEKVENNERCSNPAVPGTRFCQQHQPRIDFRRVEKSAPPPPPAKAAPAKSPPPEWQARPAAAGQAPAFPGLKADGRGILTAPNGLIWLPAEKEATPETQFNRLVRLLSALSQATPLPGQVEILRQKEQPGDILLWLSPDASQTPQPSVFYDSAAAAARLVAGRLYIGQDNSFIQYRDESAPHGYDVPNYEATHAKKELLLAASWGSRQLTASDFAGLSLADCCQQIAPQPAGSAAPPAQVYALVPQALYALLARYCRAHHLEYRLAQLQSAQQALILFQISPRPDAPAGQTVPRFILDYLTRLPQVAVLRAVQTAGDSPRILRQWQHRYPLHMAHTAAAFDPDELVLFINQPYSNLRIKPAPPFFEGDQLMAVHTPQAAGQTFKPQAEASVSALSLPVLLRPDPGPTPPTSALILTEQELGWLRPLFYRLPEEAFGGYRLCRGEAGAVLIGQNQPITGLPFGQPLRRLGDTPLFLPLRQRLVPNLPWPLLRQALEIAAGQLTFIASQSRLDLPESAFAPLGETLVSDPSRPRVTFRLQTLDSLPPLRWQAPKSQPAAPAKAQDTAEETSRPPVSPPEKSKGFGGMLAGLFGGGGKEEKAAPMPPAARPETAPPAPAPEPIDVKALLGEQARRYEDDGDFLAAAICYEFIRDSAGSARCFRRVIASNMVES